LTSYVHETPQHLQHDTAKYFFFQAYVPLCQSLNQQMCAFLILAACQNAISKVVK